jgi:hypothetical protein
VFEDPQRFREFRDTAHARLTVDICYCSTLDECWTYRDRLNDTPQVVMPVAACPIFNDDERFED